MVNFIPLVAILATTLAVSAAPSPHARRHNQYHGNYAIEYVTVTEVQTAYSGGYTPAPVPHYEEPSSEYIPTPKEPKHPSTPETHETPSGGDTPDADWKKVMLDKHNELRAQHGADPLVWDEKIAAAAYETSNSGGRHCKMEHGDALKYGENLAMLSGSGSSINSESVCKMWGQDEIASRGGHYTQMVWKGSKRLGCSVDTNCSSGMYVVRCQYDPRGNMMGAEAENVGK